MKLCILYTGEIRTLQKTIPYLKKNILMNPDIVIHIFSVIQKPNEYNNISYFQSLLEEYLYPHLKYHFWFSKENDDYYNNLKSNRIDCLPIHFDDKNYLFQSGSIIEYYLLFLAYKQAIHYQYENNITYDYICRFRTDVIYTKPLTFDFLNMTFDQIYNRLEKINDIIGDDNEENKKNMNFYSKRCITMFMNSLLDKYRIYGKLSDNSVLVNDKDFNNINTIERLKDYIINGNYIITIRKNTFFLCKKRIFDIIYDLPLYYGIFTNNKYMNNNWWDSESQLQNICSTYKITCINSTSYIEDLSLYNYDDTNYFENGILKCDNSILFFICRK